MTTEDLLDEIRRLIEAWEDENSPGCLYVEVRTGNPRDHLSRFEIQDQYAWEGEWHHYERKFINDGPH